jgi:hypothetical protein
MSDIKKIFPTPYCIPRLSSSVRSRPNLSFLAVITPLEFDMTKKIIDFDEFNFVFGARDIRLRELVHAAIKALHRVREYYVHDPRYKLMVQDNMRGGKGYKSVYLR